MKTRQNAGYVLIYVLVALVLIALIATGVLTISLNNMKGQQAAVNQMQERYAAEGQLEELMVWLGSEAMPDGAAEAGAGVFANYQNRMPSKTGEIETDTDNKSVWVEVREMTPKEWSDFLSSPQAAQVLKDEFAAFYRALRERDDPDTPEVFALLNDDLDFPDDDHPEKAFFSMTAEEGDTAVTAGAEATLHYFIVVTETKVTTVVDGTPTTTTDYNYGCAVDGITTTLISYTVGGA